jgi:hypothetical protein
VLSISNHSPSSFCSLTGIVAVEVDAGTARVVAFEPQPEMPPQNNVAPSAMKTRFPMRLFMAVLQNKDRETRGIVTDRAAKSPATPAGAGGRLTRLREVGANPYLMHRRDNAAGLWQSSWPSRARFRDGSIVK